MENNNNLITATTIQEEESKKNDLETIAGAMKSYVLQENDDVLKRKISAIKDKTLLRRFFPDKIDRIQEDFVIEEIKELYKSRNKYLKIYTQTILEIARSNANVLIATAKGTSVTIITKFVAQKIDEMDHILAKSRSERAKSIARANDDLEKYKNIDYLYEIYLNSIKTSAQEYFDWVDQLLHDFKESLNYKVKI